MTYQDFCKELKERVLAHKDWDIKEDAYKFYAKGFTSDDEQEREFILNTNVRYHSVESDVLMGDYLLLEFKKEEGNRTNHCRFSADYLYKEFLSEGWERVFFIIEQNRQVLNQNDVDGVISRLEDYEATKDRLIIRPINFSDHRYELKNNIYKTVGDIALVLYAILYDNETGLGTIKIQKPLFESWEKELDEVWELAMLNTNTYALPRMYLDPLESYKPPFSLGAFMSPDSKIKKLGPYEMPTITTIKQTNGAIAMFYPGVMEKIAELFGAGYYIAFIGINDVKVHHKDSISPRNVLGNLKAMNKQFPRELLSRKVFYYDKEEKTLTALEL